MESKDGRLLALLKRLGRALVVPALPSAITIVLFALYVFPSVSRRGVFEPFQAAVEWGNGLAVLGLFALGTLTGTTIFTFLQTPIYRFLEGYTMPVRLKRRLYRRQLARWLRIQRAKEDKDLPLIQRQLGLEDEMRYPEDLAQLQATRLGNALRSMESYGSSRYGLDTQTLWYELLATVPQNVRLNHDRARAAIDIFVSFAVHMAALSVAAFACAPFAESPLQCSILGLIAALLVVPFYLRAVYNVLEWRFAIQALVNLGRVPLAAALGLDLPTTHEEEKFVWGRIAHFVLDGLDTHWSDPGPRQKGQELLDKYRLKPEKQKGQGPETFASQVSANEPASPNGDFA